MARLAHRKAAAVLGALVFVALQSSASANHSWNGYHWPRTQPTVLVTLGDNLSASWDGYLASASADWDYGLGDPRSWPPYTWDVLDLSIVPGLAKPRNCRPTAGRVEVCNATYGKTNWLGAATIWISGGHITQGTVKVNDTYFNTAKYNTPAWKNLVMCQELAHTFGLDHQDEDFDNQLLGSCMDYSSDPTLNQHPNFHDYEQLDLLYDHFDAFAVAKSSPGAAGAVLESPSEWGQLMKSSRGGRLQVFERDFGNNQRIVTFVIWA